MHVGDMGMDGAFNRPQWSKLDSKKRNCSNPAVRFGRGNGGGSGAFLGLSLPPSLSADPRSSSFVAL